MIFGISLLFDTTTLAFLHFFRHTRHPSSNGPIISLDHKETHFVAINTLKTKMDVHQQARLEETIT